MIAIDCKSFKSTRVRVNLRVKTDRRLGWVFLGVDELGQACAGVQPLGAKGMYQE